MAQWGQNDQANNSVLWGPAKFKKAPNTANRDALYQNTTPDAFVKGETVGQYGVDNVEIATGVQQLTTVVLVNNGTAGSYIPGEILDIDSTGANGSSDASLEVATTEVRTATVNAVGTGYSNGDTVQLNTGTGDRGLFTVTTGESNTSVVSVAINDRGQFTVNPTLVGGATSAVTGSGSGLTLDVTTRINSVSINSVGSYSELPTNLEGNELEGSASGEGATADLLFAVVGAGSVAHTGWVVRKEGTGGRAGRVQTEVLVAGGIVTDSGDDDDQFPGGV